MEQRRTMALIGTPTLSVRQGMMASETAIIDHLLRRTFEKICLGPWEGRRFVYSEHGISREEIRRKHLAEREALSCVYIPAQSRADRPNPNNPTITYQVIESYVITLVLR